MTTDFFLLEFSAAVDNFNLHKTTIMSIPYALIAVFTQQKPLLSGNTAAVFLLEKEWSLEKMQQLANDLNQPATTFLWKATQPGEFHVRWVAPDAEIQVCGHGAMAAIAFLGIKFPDIKQFKLLGKTTTMEGICNQEQHTAEIVLDAIPVVEQIEIPATLPAALGVEIEAYFTSENKDIVLLKNEATVAGMQPDFTKLKQVKTFGYAITAPGDKVDFVSRTIVPHVLQLEDHATGSSHALLTPFWAERLKKNAFTAQQLSRRGGAFFCELLQSNKVSLKGHYSVVMNGNVSVNQ